MPRWTQTAHERFWAKVDRRGPDDCWLWKASRQDRYGQVYWRGRPVKAQRVSWELTFSDPGKRSVLHRCDNPLCVNPAHLFIGTQTGNLNDMWAKNRGARGEGHYKAKLTWEQVKDIRARFRKGERLFELAERFSIHRMCIRRIVDGKTWKRRDYTRSAP